MQRPVDAQAPVSERRTTTVLFGDLVAFTSYSEGRDPEEVRELLSAYFAVARTVVGRYGGTIEKFIGDAVMAVWGVPVSHEDDAERAVRAGLDLVTEIAALGTAAGAPGLSMRVGIVTGSVAVTLGATNEGMVAGDAVNTAARVQTAAEPGSVWVDAETRSLTQAAVAFSDMGGHALKGKAEPVRLFRADTVVAAVGGAQRVDGLEAPMTGRDAELRAVKEALHATQGDGRARVVVITGVAGVGKSRLGWEFEKYVDGLSDPVAWHRGRSLSYGERAAFWAFAEMVRSRLGILETDDRQTVHHKIVSGVRRVALDEEEATWLGPRVAALVSGGAAGGSFDRTDLFVAWTTFLERVGGQDPVVLVFEDAQYADAGLLDLIEHLLRSIRCRLLVVLLARPDLLARRPGIAAGRASSTVDLAPLPDRAMASLLDGLVHELPVRARTALVARAEGVPLYAVETVRSLVDQGAVVVRDGRHVFVDHDHTVVDLDRLTAPTSLQTLIAARLDALTPIERRTVQDASVLGLTFPYTSLLALTGISSYALDEALAGLVGKGVLETQDDPRSPELGQFRFLQAMVREVAYSTLARSDRRARHLAAADQLTQEQTEGDAAAGIIAQHLLDALATTPAHDPERAQLSGRARGLLVTAATRAERLGAPEDALANTRAALGLGPTGQEAAELQERGARVALQAGQPTLGLELAAAAVEGWRAEGLVTGEVRALTLQAGAFLQLGRVSEAEELGVRAERLQRGRSDLPPEDLTELLTVLHVCARARGDRTGQQESALRVMTLGEELDDPLLVVRGLNRLAILLLDLGSSAAHRALVERSIVLAREKHLLPALALSLINLASEMYSRDLEAAAPMVRESIDVSAQVGDAQRTEGALTNAGYLWLLTGDWDVLLDETEAWFEGRETTATSGPLWLVRAQVQLARGLPVDQPVLPASEDPYDEQVRVLVRSLVQAQEGEVVAAADEVAGTTWKVFAEDGLTEDFEMLWAPAVELQLRVGDVEAAGRLMELAEPFLGARRRMLTDCVVHRLRGLLALARGEDPEADLREAEAALVAYGAPYLLARTRLELGRWLVGQGRGEEATVMLVQAWETLVALGAAPSVVEVDAVLGAESVRV